MQHRGEIVESVVRNSGMALSLIHKALGISRGTLYNKFDEANLDFAFIQKLGEVIMHDFSKEFPEMYTPLHKSEQVLDTGVEQKANASSMDLKECEQELITLQRKYISLLEEHLKLKGENNKN